MNKEFSNWDKKVSWNVLFDSEEELIEKLVTMNVKDKRLYGVMGEVFLEGLQKYYAKKGFLTPAQLTQLKRGAKEIWKWWNATSINGATGMVITRETLMKGDVRKCK